MLTVTNGSSTASVASGTLSQQNLIWFYDGTNTGVFEYSVSGAAVQLAGVWTGASGTFPAMSTGGGPLVLGGQVQGGYGAISSTSVPGDSLIINLMLEKPWACKYNSPTSLTLFRPWDGGSGTGYLSYYNVPGWGTQPFFFGIATNKIRWGSQNANSATASGFAALLPSMGNWYNTHGYDTTNSHGTFYFTASPACGSPTDVAAGNFASIHGYEGCGPVGLTPGNFAVARVDSVEGGSAMLQYYLASPSAYTRSTVDRFYGAIFGAPNTCGPTVSSGCDGIVAAPNNMNATKWPGFYFGMGGFFTNSWPAVRGSAQPARPRNIDVAALIGTAASSRLTVTAPSGSVSSVACSALPCAIVVDDRQGSYWFQLQKLSSSGQVVSTAAPVLLPLPPQP
jgi:hypothetical protein